MDLSRLFHPRSIAVVGATDRPGAYGAQVLGNLLRAGPTAHVTGVHPTRRRVLGIGCVPRLEDLPEPVDAVVVATPAATVGELVASAGQLGCGGAVVFAAGFGESGNGAAQHRLVEVARRYRLPVIGPNANGLVSIAGRAPLWGDPVTMPEAAGPIALVTQSGNLGVIALAHRAGLGLHSVVSLGNAAVVDAPDVVDHLAGDPSVACIAAYLEDDGDGARLATSLARCARAGVAVVVLKAGRSQAGRAAGAAHTAALSGDHAAFRALVEQAGGVLVSTPHALLETARAMTRARRHRGGLAVLSSSGGDAAIAADLAADAGVRLAPLTEQTRTALVAALPPTATVTNPLDHTNLVWADVAALTRIAQVLGSDSGVGHLIYVQDEPPGLPEADRVEWALTRDAALAGAERAGLPPLLVATTPGQEPPGAVSGLGPALAAIRALTEPAPDVARLQSIAAAAARVAGREPGPWLSEHEAKDLLAAAGIAVPRRVTVPIGRDHAQVRDAAVQAARLLDGAVVLKLSAAGLVHKAQAGAIALDLRDAAAVQDAAYRLLALADGYRQPALLVEQQVRAGHELFVAARSDGVVPTLTVGMGGAWAELLDDVVVLPLPVSPGQVLDGLGRLRAADLLAGAWPAGRADQAHGTGGPALALAELAAAAGRLLVDAGLTLVELNPVIVNDSGAVAVDAVVRTSGRSGAPSVA